MVSKDWTFEEVMAAEGEYILNGGGILGINSPLTRWHALQQLDEYRDRYGGGEKIALMLAIRVCGEFEFVMPQWVAEAYLNAINLVMIYEKGSWDDVFGAPNPKGANLEALRKKHLLEGRVYLAVRDIILKDPKRAIDVDLFDEAGEKLGIGKTTAEKYYRSMVKQGCDPLPEIKKNIDDPRYQILRKRIQE